MHQAQPKEGHKIWLTQEADAKSWSSLKHVQPKEGLKELGIRYHNPRESRHFPRGALFFFSRFEIRGLFVELSPESQLIRSGLNPFRINPK